MTHTSICKQQQQHIIHMCKNQNGFTINRQPYHIMIITFIHLLHSFIIGLDWQLHPAVRLAPEEALRRGLIPPPEISPSLFAIKVHCTTITSIITLHYDKILKMNTKKKIIMLFVVCLVDGQVALEKEKKIKALERQLQSRPPASGRQHTTHTFWILVC